MKRVITASDVAPGDKYWSVVYRDIKRNVHGIVFRCNTRLISEAEKFADMFIPEPYTLLKVVESDNDKDMLISRLADKGYDVKVVANEEIEGEEV